MGRIIVKLKGLYFEYSSIVDAPVTFGMALDEFREYYQGAYGTEGMRHLPERLERVEKYGTSSHYQDRAEDVLKGNRAGPDKSTLTVDEIYTTYCEMKPIRGGWMVPVAREKS